MTPQFVDMSAWQPASVDWPAYVAWAKSFDGVSRVSIRASEYLGKVDSHYLEYKDGFLSAGGNIIIHYAYVYPQRNGPFPEADWMFKAVGDLAKRPLDVLELDFEEQVQQANAAWAYAWLAKISQYYNGRLPTLYASDSYIRQRLQGVTAINKFPLTLAKWEFTPTERPPAPPPWTSYEYLQYADNVKVPGIGSKVDGDIYLGREVSPPPAIITPSLPIKIGSPEDFKLVFSGPPLNRWMVVAKHSSEAKLKQEGYFS